LILAKGHQNIPYRGRTMPNLFILDLSSCDVQRFVVPRLGYAYYSQQRSLFAGRIFAALDASVASIERTNAHVQTENRWFDVAFSGPE
jgi:hypothetical protein